MGFRRVNVSPELIAIAGCWLTILVFFLDYTKDMSDYRAEMRSGIDTFRTGTAGETANSRAEVSGGLVGLEERMTKLEERMAYVEGLLQGYIEESRPEREAATTK